MTSIPPKPILRKVYRPYPKRLPAERKPMTVCIAATCENGRVVVAATDSATWLNQVTSDNRLPKMIWRDDWLFMYAGEPSNTELILADIREKLTYRNIRDVVHSAFQKRLSRWSSDGVLGPFNMDMEEFKKTGRAAFGDEYAAMIARQIDENAQQFTDQLLTIGWQDNEQAVVIHEENKSGSASHAYLGYAAIGIGAPTAMAHLLALRQARHWSLTDTLYAVATAKFAAEAIDGVGKHTNVWITWKRRESDSMDRPPGTFVQPEELLTVQSLWSRPFIPPSVYPALMSVLQKSGIDFTHSSAAAAKHMEFSFAKHTEEAQKQPNESGEKP